MFECLKCGCDRSAELSTVGYSPATAFIHAIGIVLTDFKIVERIRLQGGHRSCLCPGRWNQVEAERSPFAGHIRFR